LSPTIKVMIAIAALLTIVPGCASRESPPDLQANKDSADAVSDNDPPKGALAPESAYPDIEKYLAQDGKSGWRVIMLGVDGLEPEALQTLIAAGRLPNFKRLMDEGASGILKTDFADSPITWTTIATGVRCEKHGLCPNTIDGISFEQTLKNIKYPRLWEVLPIYGMQPYVAEYYFTGTKFPPYGHGYPTKGEVTEDMVNPSLAQVLKKHQRLYEKFHFGGAMHIPYSDLSEQMRDTPVRFHAIREYSGDLFISHFQNTDEVGHYEWGFYRILRDNAKLSEATKKRSELGRDIFAAVYGDMDRQIGKVREEFPKALIVICSDHGMHAMNPMTIYLIPQPKLFSMMGLPREINPGESERIPGSETMVTLRDGKDQLRMLGDTQFMVMMPLIHFGGAGAEKAALDAFAAVRELKIKDIPIFEMVSDKEIGVSKRLVDNWQELPSFGGDFMLFGTLTGSHIANDDGVFILHGPGVKKGVRLEGASVEDIAPTIYAYLGIPLAKDLDGKPLTDAFNKGFMPGFEKPKVESYGIAPYYQPGGAKRELSTEEKNRLRSLGYLR
jgi:predicted AlkP superfamily phosphohydrolase/phosphomutase